MDKVLVAPSILSADFSKLGDEIKAVEKAEADWIHFDIMDGEFVPNLTIGPCVVRSVRKVSKIFFDVHLMIKDPLSYVKPFSKAGADLITFHIEACQEPLGIINAIKECNIKAGISIKPNTPASSVTEYLDKIDMILVMSVEPGFGGQSFMDSAIPKIKELRKVFRNDIQVDGGINPKNAKEVVRAGANVLVAGTSVFGSQDYKEAIRGLKGE